MTYTKGDKAYAERRALNILDRWIDTTGVIQKHTSYYYELQGLVKDAVACGAQRALGIEQKLESERE